MLPIAVIDRPGWRLPALASRAGRAFSGRRLPEARATLLATTQPPAWMFITGPTLQLSSTQLRLKAVQRQAARKERETAEAGTT
jgi:nicotinate-nucleotide adenylyltransferase